jgi:hypothetical protein
MQGTTNVEVYGAAIKMKIHKCYKQEHANKINKLLESYGNFVWFVGTSLPVVKIGLQQFFPEPPVVYNTSRQ